MSALTYYEILISGSDVVIDRLANDMQNLYKEYNEGIVDNGAFIDYSKALNFIETHIVEVNRRIQGNLFAVDENVFDTSVFGEFADSHDRYDYANAINWEDLEREYRYYKTKNDDRFYYQFYRNDYLAKKSLSENQINDIDEYFRFYEEEYGRKFIYNDLKKDVDVEKLKKKYGKWYDDLRTPSSILELQWWFLQLDSLECRQNEIEIISEAKGMGDYFFEWLTENLDVIVKSREQFEDDYRPSTFYYYKGNKIGSKEYKDLVESVKVPGKEKGATKKISYVQVQFNTNPGIRYTYYMITGKKIEPGQLVDTGNDHFGNYGVVVGVSDKKPELAGIELTKCKDNMSPSEVFKLNPMLKDKLLALWSRTLIEAQDISWAKKVNDKIEKKTGDYLINELLIKYNISDLEDLKLVDKAWTKDELTRKIARTKSINASNIKNIKKIIATSDYKKYDIMLEEIIDTSRFDNERLNLLKVALIDNITKEQIEYLAHPSHSFSKMEQLINLMYKGLDYK